MNGLDRFYSDEPETSSPLKQGVLRAANILRQPRYHINQLRQFGMTVRHPEVDYDIDPDKKTIAIVPGLSCSVPTYQRLIEQITKDGKFNVLKLEDFPEDFRAIFSRLSLTERAELLLDTLKNHDSGPVTLIGHSIGGPVATYTRILAEQEGNEGLVDQVINLSAPYNSTGLAKLPLLPRWFKSLRDLAPDSDFMQKVQAEGRVDHRFITKRDEIIRRGEMDFSSGEEHLVDHGHFDYMLGSDEVISDTAEKIVNLLSE